MHVDAEGAAQVLLLGRANSGKSSLLATVTHAEPTIADYSFSTTRPQPGMMKFEDVQLQLVDLPPISAAHMDSWIAGLAQSADAALLFANPATPGVLAGVEEILDRLGNVHVPLVGGFPDDADPRDLPLPTMMVISKCDLTSEEDMEVVEELYGDRFPVIRFSAEQRIGVQALKTALWRMLGLVRVYTKKRGKPAERRDPFVLHEGATVLDLAARIHQDLEEKMTYARVWGGKIEGQKVSRDFELRDRDVVETGT